MNYKVLLLDTSFATQFNLQQDISNTLRYLIDNRDIVLLQSQVQTLCQTKTLATTPITKLFENIYQNNLIDEYALIDTTLSSQSSPELLTIPDIVVDMKQFNNAAVVLNSIKEYKNKIIINTAPFIRKNRDGMINLTDINEFHRQIVRGALVSSYYNTNDSIWLNPNLIKFITETYAKCISSVIQRLYNLTLVEQNTISIILAWFFLQRMTDDHEELLMQCDFLGSKMSIRQSIEMFKEYIGNNGIKDINDLSRLISLCGPSNMRNFNSDIYTRLMSKSGTSFITMRLAIEYPPYWVYQLLIALSGIKINLSFLLQKTKLMKPASEFFLQLSTCRQFIPSVGYITKGMSNLNNFQNVIKYNTFGRLVYSKSDNGWSSLDNKIIFESPSVESLLTKKQKKTYLDKLNTKPIIEYPFSNILCRKLNISNENLNDVKYSLHKIRISQNGTLYKWYKFSYKENSFYVEMSVDNSNKIYYNTNIPYLDSLINNEIDNDNIENEQIEKNETTSIFDGYVTDNETNNTNENNIINSTENFKKNIVFNDNNNLLERLLSLKNYNQWQYEEIKNDLNPIIDEYEKKIFTVYEHYKAFYNTELPKCILEINKLITEVYSSTNQIEIDSIDQFTSSIINKIIYQIQYKSFENIEINYSPISFTYIGSEPYFDINEISGKTMKNTRVELALSKICAKILSTIKKYNNICEFITLNFEYNNSLQNPVINLKINTSISEQDMKKLYNILNI